VVLIVFDELDYRIAFESRPAGVELPGFDSLRQSGMFALAAESPGPNTSESMISYLIGRRVLHTVGAGPRTAEVLLQGELGRRSLDSLTPTLMQRVRRRSENAALVGWTVPYCRTVLGKDLVDCHYWPAGNHLGVREDWFSTMVHQWSTALPCGGRLIHLVRFRQMMAALAAAADPGLQVVLLHLPVPHDPWIYSGSHDRIGLTEVGPRGYLANLELADQALRKLRAAIRVAGLESRTTLIVTADHSWRRSARFDGKHDPRVPFIVWYDGSSQLDCPAGFNTVVTGDLILTLANLRLASSDICGWLGRTARPAGNTSTH
jgi:hypothetical protein